MESSNIYKLKRYKMTMKKKSAKKKTNASKVSKCKPFFNDKRLVAIAIALFFVFAIVLSFVNVPQVSITGQSVEGLGFGNVSVSIGTFLTNFLNPEQADATLLKYVFFILLTIFIFSLLSMADFPQNSLLRWVFALPIAFISIAYIAPAELFAAIIPYSALGMTFIVIIPLFLIVLFTSQMLKGKLTHGKILIQLMVWYFYLAFLCYFLVRAITDTNNVYSGGVLAIIIGGIILGLIVIIKNKKFRKWIRDLVRESRRETVKDIKDIKRAEEEEERKSGEAALKSAEKVKYK